MKAPQLDAEINSYKQKIQKLDSLAADLPEEQLSKYRAVRNRFEQRLKAWKQILDSDLAVFNNNVSEGYHEVEAQLFASKRKQT